MLGFMTLALAVTILAATNAWTPLPVLDRWWTNLTALSKPAPAWTIRMSGAPDIAGVTTDGVVVLATRGFVEAFARSTGAPLWQHQASWALPAGDVVVMHMRPTDPDAEEAREGGYSVVQPLSGTVIWSEPDATSVWAFADSILDLVCADRDSCTLRLRRHGDNGSQIWSIPVSGDGRRIAGPSPPLATPRDPAGWFTAAAAGAPGPVPAVIGLPIDGRIHLIDTLAGRHIRELEPPGRHDRLTFSGERVVGTRPGPGGEFCLITVEAFHYASGDSVWRNDAVDLDTTSGAGCEQRRDPLGAGGFLSAVRADGRPALIAASDGSERWVGAAGERVLAIDDRLAAIQGADGRTVRILDLVDENREVWSGQIGLRPEAAITRDLIFLHDRDKGRLVVVSHNGASQLADVKVDADIVGFNHDSIVIARGRTIGLLGLPFSA
jgi:outer membrane protein assembly factor BamB